jgi:hypothetical protein
VLSCLLSSTDRAITCSEISATQPERVPEHLNHMLLTFVQHKGDIPSDKRVDERFMSIPNGRAHKRGVDPIAVRPLPSRCQQSPDAIMNGAVLNPDKVCSTCRSSAFELSSGNRPEAPVRCGHCQANLGSWSTFRRRVGRVLLLRPAAVDRLGRLSDRPGRPISHPSMS